MARDLAMGAHRFASRADGYLLADFSASVEQARLVVSLLGLVSGWRGVSVFVGPSARPVRSVYGQLENVARVLSCFVGSADAPQREAWCGSVSRSLFVDDVIPHPPALVPCHLLVSVFPSPLSRVHPAPLATQLAARAVDAGCDFCPAWSAASFRFLPG